MARIPSLDDVYGWIPEENRHKLDQSFQSDYRSLAQIADNILEWDGPVGDELTLTHIERHDIKAENPFDARQQRCVLLGSCAIIFLAVYCICHLLGALTLSP